MSEFQQEHEETIENSEEKNIGEETVLIEEAPPEAEHDNDADQAGAEEKKEKKEGEDQNGEEDSRFKVGQAITLVKVRFPGNAKAFPFLVNSKKFAYGQKVVALSDRGMAVGHITSFPYETTFQKNMLPLNSIMKAATENEQEKDRDILAKEREAKDICQELVERLKLDMELTHVEYTQFGKKAVFYFTSPGRVDFRELVKELVSKLKMRIELRQIYIRDRTAGVGGIGPCGQQICCSRFLPKYGNVNIKMAKNQNVTLSPNKLNGICGQLKCCMSYEDDVYSEKRSRLPNVGDFIETLNGDRGKVLAVEILIEEFTMLTDKGSKRRYSSALYDSKITLPEGYKFPEIFDYVSDDTFQLITEVANKTVTVAAPVLESAAAPVTKPKPRPAPSAASAPVNKTMATPNPAYNLSPEEQADGAGAGAAHNFQDDGKGLLSHQLGQQQRTTQNRRHQNKNSSNNNNKNRHQYRSQQNRNRPSKRRSED